MEVENCCGTILMEHSGGPYGLNMLWKRVCGKHVVFLGRTSNGNSVTVADNVATVNR